LNDETDTVRRPAGWRARRNAVGEPRAYRLASSIRLPWAVGLVSLLLLALGITVLVGRGEGSGDEVPQALLDAQQAATVAAAQSVRRGLNEDVSDLVGLAALIGAQQGPAAPGELAGALDAFQVAHPRYLSLYVLDGQDTVVAQTGSPPQPALLPTGDTLLAPGITGVRAEPGSNVPVIQEFTPLADRRRTLVARYDPGFLRFGLETAEPGQAWVVDEDGRAIASLDGAASLAPLARASLREAARKAAAGESGAIQSGGSLERRELVGYAPLTGVGPAGDLGWGVVTARSVTSFALPATDARREILLAGILLALVSVLVFGWLYLVVIHPVLRLQAEAERLAYGDLSRSVEVIRYDEIGLVARALERIRIVLIRRRVQGRRGDDEG
jgi:HAMP domain-containing protein